MKYGEPADYIYNTISPSDGEEIISLFNYYVINSDAAFLESPVSPSFFDQVIPFLEHYPNLAVRNDKRILVGFGLLRPYNPMPAFQNTAVISYFLDPAYTGRGIGSKMLSLLEEAAGKKGIMNILAEISSRNEGSIRFHEQHGFIHRGIFIGVGIKNGSEFDTIWMQKKIIPK